MLMIALALATSVPTSAEARPPVATAVARAMILPGVRVDAAVMSRATDWGSVMPRPRQIACPTDLGTACRLITIDMP